MVKKLALLGVVFVLASGCVASRTARFRPAGASGQSGRGYPATQQAVLIAGVHAARVSMWSPGVYPIRTGERPIVHVALGITNDGRTPMQLDMTTTQLGITTGRRVLPLARPYHVAGATTIAPGQTQRIDLYYALPEGVPVWKITTFNQSWGLQTSAGKVFQYTPFARYRRRRGYTRDYYVRGHHPRHRGISYWQHHRPHHAH